MSFVKKLNLICIAGFILFFTACSRDEDKLNVRITATSKNAGDIEFSVVLENACGNVINGASVFVRDCENIITHLIFDNESQSYKGELSSTGNLFAVEVRSLLLENRKQIEIPHKVLFEKPAINIFSDSEGNSVMEGNTLDSNKEISLSWKKIDDDVVYTLVLRNAGQILFCKSTQSNSMVLPAKSLPENSLLFANVSCQKNYGDITYSKCDYYSVSIIESSSISFNTK
jgi:hypothetical protein